MVGRLLAPLVVIAGLWHGPRDGCATAIGIVPSPAINLAVAPHVSCKFALLITEGALEALSARELQAALAHELGHVQLGHLAARKARREAEQRTEEQIGSAGGIAAATASAIPGIGPLLAVGMMAAQTVADLTAEGVYRGYDQAEEVAADRFAANLLDRAHPNGCRSLVELFDRLQDQRHRSAAGGWFSTHPAVGSRLAELAAACPAP